MNDIVEKRQIEPLFLSLSRYYLASKLKGVTACLLVFASAVLIAVAIYQINASFEGHPENAVKVVAILFSILGVTPTILYLAALKRKANIADLGLLIIGSIAILLLASYFFYASYYIRLPADIVIWSESDFVNDILKFRIGYPLFTQQSNNESFTYVPGSQIVTYFLAWFVGQPLSIPVFRSVQVIYTLITVIVALLTCRRLVGLASENDAKICRSAIWTGTTFSVLFLIAVNSITNPFSFLLHNDALAQLVIVTAFWLLLEYGSTRNRWILLLMAFVPAAGFWVKQSLVVWALLYTVYLVFFDQPRSIKRIILLCSGSLAGYFVSLLVGYALWQENFYYWTITVLGSHAVSMLRSFRHLLICWPYFAMGLVGVALLVRVSNAKKSLIGVGAIWLFLISIETYTSGIAWMTNHLGPGSLIGGVFFLAGITPIWANAANFSLGSASLQRLLIAGISVASFCLLFSGLGLVRIPAPPFSENDASRYIRQIEQEFADVPHDRVLLDVGSWIYLQDGIVMKDRAPSIGERGISETGDFSGILRRIRGKTYAKILVRNFHSGDFWYDHELWERSSEIRQALMENYLEKDRIERVSGIPSAELPYGFNEISILVPRN